MRPAAVGGMKRICAGVLALVLAFGAAGCGERQLTPEECRALLDDPRPDREAVLREFHDAGCAEDLSRSIFGHLTSGELTATERLEACQALLDLSQAQLRLEYLGAALDTMDAWSEAGCGTGYRGGE